MTIMTRRGAQPRRVIEAVSGKTLPVESHPDGWMVPVPDFEYLAVVVLEF